MFISHREQGLLVADDVLPADCFRAIGEELANGEYRFVHHDKWDKAWRLWDGQPLRGQSLYYDPHGLFRWKGPTYPTGSQFDKVIEAVRIAADENPDIAGREGREWAALYVSPWLYPPDSALALHQDTGRYSGSFTLFAHARWNPAWGGELVVSRPRPPGSYPVDAARGPRGDAAWMSDEGADITDDHGIATCVVPRPNRLAILGANSPHRIARVDRCAGAHIRISVAGFFMCPP